jgi:hypothetical protein
MLAGVVKEGLGGVRVAVVRVAVLRVAMCGGCTCRRRARDRQGASLLKLLVYAPLSY